jgi:lipopolysaccharide biosynthesis regulator YciM
MVCGGWSHARRKAAQALLIAEASLDRDHFDRMTALLDHQASSF